MFSSQQSKDIKEVEAVIGPSVRVKGNFHSKGNVIVEGVLSGSLKSSAYIFVGDDAEIKANIVTNEARIGGKIIGNITVKKSLVIAKSANIEGNIECESLTIEMGAYLNGNCKMNLDTAENKDTEKKTKTK